MDSTYFPGALPAPPVTQNIVERAYETFRDVNDGEPSSVYPALEQARTSAFGIALTGVNGSLFSLGDCNDRFTIMSVSKPFVLALVCSVHGIDPMRDQLGVDATGLPFNSLEAVSGGDHGRTNPMVNPGAIAATSRVPGATQDARWDTLRTWLSQFAGRELSLDDEVLESARLTNHRNRQLAEMLASYGALATDPAEAVDLYTMQCSLAVSAVDLATMGSTIAAGGVNPVTGQRVVEPSVCRHVLASMATAGMYERSGTWLWDVGLPGKSGISGGIVTIAPGKGALATWSPPIDAAGNSVRGVLVAEMLAGELGLDVFAVPRAEDELNATVVFTS